MRSKTKYPIEKFQIIHLFQLAGIEGVTAVNPLGAGEFNSVFLVATPDREYVIKIAPADERHLLTYEKGMMQAELFWYRQLREKTSIRVPQIHFSDFSRTMIPTDYFILEKMPGKPMNQMDFSSEEKAEAVRTLARMAAQMHEIRHDQFGYIQNGLFDHWYDAFHSMIENLLMDAEKKKKKSKNGERLLHVVEKHKDILEKVPCCMVNFDLWEPNILCSREQGTIQYALIDPERTFWGDPIADWVPLDFFHDLPDKAESLLAYNEISRNRVLVSKEEKNRFRLMKGYLALLMEVEKYYRYSPFHWGWWRNQAVSTLLYADVWKHLSERKI